MIFDLPIETLDVVLIAIGVVGICTADFGD
jgi:hypothetical protein